MNDSADILKHIYILFRCGGFESLGVTKVTLTNLVKDTFPEAKNMTLSIKSNPM